ncbi:uncharacterized protein TRAVEDRAFT_158572 [Trametes versicolor FP-101664 SS1]|uniref:uncharacterized protein n=1 Tax=Trametes versicolor (strain FP-101664) TaxID=717944 RepID=UPI0004622292|nr:uncharacterized protein TRAVEDRAFT_158572 [Trametes versicolor FP-101664 SS1]EIW64380.1 hypothetical protein TRAVEDRAFT_158572 [Trametes versicolor FP-101664 SS1]
MSKSWFDHAFGSRADAELLLRPDLESGLLSQHDYALAVDFLPGPVRYLPYLHTAAWGALAGLAVWRFKPKVRFSPTIVAISASTGYGAGLVHYIREHKRFARQLDDREAFLVALDNVNRRLGNAAPLFPQVDRDRIMDRIKKQREQNGEILDGGIEIVSDFGDSADSTASTGTPSSSNASQEPAVRQKSTWDAIREANARNNGRRSSWDELRQRHERQRTAGRVQQNESAEDEDPRAQAQAEFDAILEAERKVAQAS